MPLSAEDKLKQEQAPEKLAIGGDSGFQVDSPSHNIDKHSELILLGSNVKVPLPCPELPELVLNAVDAIQVQCSLFSMVSVVRSHIGELGMYGRPTKTCFCPATACMHYWLWGALPWRAHACPCPPLALLSLTAEA